MLAQSSREGAEMGQTPTQHVRSIIKSSVHCQPNQRTSGPRVTRPTLPRLAHSPATCRHALSASRSPAVSQHMRGRLRGRQRLRGAFVLASLLHCPMCKRSRPLESHGHGGPFHHHGLASPGIVRERDMSLTAAARGMLSSEYAPDTSSSPGTQPHPDFQAISLTLTQALPGST